MKIPDHDDTDENIINTSSLVDIMFILIIFFIVTMTFNEEEHDIEVNLPDTDSTLSSSVKAMVINVRQDGSYYLGARRMTITEIRSELTKALKNNRDQKVLIRGDRNALHGHVAAAVAACKNSGIKEANIGYVTKTTR